MKIEITIKDSMDRVIVKGSEGTEEMAEEELGSLVRYYKKHVCEFCDGTGELHEDEHDANGQLSGIGTVTVPCSCQKRDEDNE